MTAPIWIPIVLIVGIPLALTFGLLQQVGWIKPKEDDLRPEEVAEYLRNFIEGTSGPWDWDDFENMKLKDPALEAIRNDACWAAPKADFAKLDECLAKAEALANQAKVVQTLTDQPG